MEDWRNVGVATDLRSQRIKSHVESLKGPDECHLHYGEGVSSGKRAGDSGGLPVRTAGHHRSRAEADQAGQSLGLAERVEAYGGDWLAMMTLSDGTGSANIDDGHGGIQTRGDWRLRPEPGRSCEEHIIFDSKRWRLKQRREELGG